MPLFKEKKVFWWISSISKVAIILVNSISWFPNYIVVTFCLVKHESQNVVATRPDIIDIIELNFNLKEDIKMWSKITSFKHFILILKEIYCPLHWCFCIIKEEMVHTFILALSTPFVCVLYCISWCICVKIANWRVVTRILDNQCKMLSLNRVIFASVYTFRWDFFSD